MGVRRATTHEPYIVAAHVKGKVASDAESVSIRQGRQRRQECQGSDAAKDDATKDGKPAEADAKDGRQVEGRRGRRLAGKEPEKTEINVVLVADIDWILRPIIFRIRAAGTNEDDSSQIDFKFQNIPFALNILDSLAGDDRFIDLRKRTRSHRILTKVEEATEDQRKASLDEQSKFLNDAKQQIEAAQDEVPQEDGGHGKSQRIWTRA